MVKEAERTTHELRPNPIPVVVNHFLPEKNDLIQLEKAINQVSQPNKTIGSYKLEKLKAFQNLKR
jgi:hypothetical protein